MQLRKILDEYEARVKAEIEHSFGDVGIKGPYAFPEGIIGLPSFMLDSDRFIYELRGGDEWYCDLLCGLTGMRIIHPQRKRYE